MVVVTADVTPDGLRRRYLMALHDPVVLQRPGLIVLADRWARDRADEVLAAALRARPRLAALGIGTRPTVLVTVFGSAEDVSDALGFKAAASRMVFFSYPSLRVADTAWPTTTSASWDLGSVTRHLGGRRHHPRARPRLHDALVRRRQASAVSSRRGDRASR